MKETIRIQRLGQMRALSHPLRMRLLEAFSRKPMTTKQVAAVLGEQPTKLYHHVDRLEHAGLVLLVKTRKKRGTTEKYYQTAARNFTVDRRLLHPEPKFKSTMSGMRGMITRMLEHTIQEVQESMERQLREPKEKKSHVILSRSRIRGTREQITALNRKISALLKAHELAKPSPGAIEYGCALVLYPAKEKSRRRKTRRKK